MNFIVLSIFYTFTFLSAPLLILAVWNNKPHFAFISLVLVAPICFYTAGYPNLFYVPLAFPVAIMIGAYYLKKQRPRLALIFFSPYLLLWLLVVVAICSEFFQ